MNQMGKIACAFLCLSAVAAQAAGTLPDGYTEIEYIQGPGNARIVTDYTPQPNTDKVEAVVEWPANTLAANVNQAIWCARGNGLSVDSWTLFILGTQFRFDYMPSGNAVSLTPDFTISTGTKYTITAEDNTVTYSANGAVLQTQSTPAYSFTAGSVLALFASHHSGINANLGNYGKHKLYSFKVWRSGELIHYFVPCKDPSNAATLVDICDNPATLTRSGTFTAGSEGHYFDDSLFGGVAILPIPKQMCLAGVTPEPGFTVTNYETGASWTFAEGGVAPGATPFDVAYGFANGIGTVTVTGKAGGDYEDVTLTKYYLYTDEFLVNGGFETGTLGPGWTGTLSVGDSSSAYKPNNTTTFISGTYCGFIQKSSYAQQIITVSSTCRAALSWKCKHRCDWNAGVAMYYSVLLNGEPIYPEEKTTGSDVLYRSVEGLVLEPGEHTLKFQGRTDNNGDSTLFLDDVSLRIITPLEICPIPDQTYNFGDVCRPEFTVSNILDAQTWTIGGNIVSTDFDVAYGNNGNGTGVATVTATGKGALAGHAVSSTFNLVATRLEDDNLSTGDPSVRRYEVDGKYVYVFTNAASAQVVTAKRSLRLTDCLLVGGGGAGGTTMAGGGGGGGVTNISGIADVAIPGGRTFTVSVGAGGTPSTAQSVKGGNGGETSFDCGVFSASVAGGGGGGSWDNKAGAAGSSGGGGAQNGAGGEGTEGIGFAGAAGLAANGSGSGGGGGAGHAGYTAANSRAGNGGEGVSNRITGAWVVYGGGGGGGGSGSGYGTYNPGFGGLGGGGDGGKAVAGNPGADGLGGGGGGGGWSGSLKSGGRGGSGTVILAVTPNDIDTDLADQVWNHFDPCRPEITVSNVLNGTTWTVGGDIESPYFDVEYRNNVGIGTASVFITGKGDCAGLFWSGVFNITATKYEDANISTTDLTVQRLEVDGRYVYVFTNTVSAQTVTANRMIALDGYLLVAGGGGGGRTMGGGGGAGGVATNAAGFAGILLPRNGTFTVAVGAGGAGSASQDSNGGNGGDTSLAFGSFAVNAPGGGGGGSWGTATAGARGGSGGGGANGGAAGLGADGYGFAGAASLGANNRSGGGGGAGHAGYKGDSTANHSGYGGEGVSNRITGAWVVYGGGGGAGGSNNGWGLTAPGLGGLGGGGNGSKGIDGSPGTDGLGGGGGGGGYGGGNGYSSTYAGLGGRGGSGIAILAIKATDFEVDPIPDQVLSGGVSEPLPVVRSADGETLLVKDADYTVSYTGNDRAGTAIATITGINGYAGKSTDVGFKIVGRLFAKPSVDVEGDGTSWANAMSVAKAFETLAHASGYNELWMQAGTVSQPAFSITNSGYLVVRGGFAGTEAALEDRQPDGITVFDGETTSAILLAVDSSTDSDLVLDRIRFCRARKHGFIKTGGGSLAVLGCAVEANGRYVGAEYGRGMSAQSDGFGSLVVSNCVFAGNRTRNKDSGDRHYGGFGLYAKSFKTAVVDASLFVTNGYDFGIQPGGDYAGYLNARGSALYAENTPITVRGCRFAGNNCPIRQSNDMWCGGTIALEGACGGSAIENCALIGNTEHISAGDDYGANCGGAIAIRLSSKTDKATIRNCTIAYNLTESSNAGGGITVTRGDVAVENSIIWQNRRYKYTKVGFGSDVQVQANGSASIRHSLVTTLDGTGLVGANLTVDENTVSVVDPRLVTSTATFESLLTVLDSYQYYTPTNPTIYEDLATMDAHLLSPAGYCVNGGAIGPTTTWYSPAIDLGNPAADYSREPAPNGSRLNLGAYGNTAEASRTATGQPSAEVTVAFLDGTPRPVVGIAMGLESGTGYSATVRLHCSTGGVTLVDNEYRLVVNGDVIEWKSPVFLEPGTTLEGTVTIVASGARTVSYPISELVTGTYPPHYGKGGGPNVIHVREGADGLMDGTSWTDAYPDIKSALTSIQDDSKTEMWLSVTNDYLNESTTIAYPLTIRGGFAGVENAPDERTDGCRSVIDGREAFEGFNIKNTAAVDIERIVFTRGLDCGLIKTGAGDLRVSDCHFLTNGMGRATNASGKGARVSGTASTTAVTFTNCVFRGNRTKPGSDGGKSASGAGINASSLKGLRLEDCYFVHNGIHLRAPGGGSSYEPSSGGTYGSAVYSTVPVSAVGCRFVANFGGVLNNAGNIGGVVRLQSGAEGSAFTNCAWVANGEEIVWQNYGTGGNNIAGALTVQFASAAGTVDVDNCTFAYNLVDGYETTAGLNLVLGTANVRNSIFYGNILGGTSKTRGADISLRGESVLNVAYTLFGELGSNSVTCAETATTNFLDGIVVGDPLFVTEFAAMTNLVKESSTKSATGDKLVFWDWTAATAPATYAALEAADVHLRSCIGSWVDGRLTQDFKKQFSPAIDAGDPESDFSREPVIHGFGGNGGRVNLGAYGNTPEAALSPFRATMLILR